MRPPAPDVDRVLRAGCATASLERSLLPSNVLFVIDRSQSMACNPPPVTDSGACESNPQRSVDSSPSKWEITRAALLGVIAALPSDISVGLSYFSNDDLCGVHALPSVELSPLTSTQRQVINASLSAVEPAGGTPVVGATIVAYQHLHRRALAGTLRGNKYVVLLSDGAQSDSCVDAARCATSEACTQRLIEEEVPKAAGAGVGIRTFVIGAPGSEPARSTLSRIAAAGGTGAPGCVAARGDCHFDMTLGDDFTRALGDALQRISGATTLCELPLPTPDEGVDVDPDFVNVIYSPGDGGEPTLIPQRPTAECNRGVRGWAYDPTGTRVTLCEALCDAVRNDVRGRVDVVLGCRTEGPQ